MLGLHFFNQNYMCVVSLIILCVHSNKYPDMSCSAIGQPFDIGRHISPRNVNKKTSRNTIHWNKPKLCNYYNKSM